MPRRALIDRATAEEIAIQGLSFLSASPTRLGSFLEATGIRPDAFRVAAQSPSFLSGLLDYIVADEEILISFASEMGVPPESIMDARRVLSPSDFFE